MRIDSTKKDKKKKKQKSILEDEVFRIMQMSLKSAMDASLNEIFNEWNKSSNTASVKINIPFKV